MEDANGVSIPLVRTTQEGGSMGGLTSVSFHTNDNNVNVYTRSYYNGEDQLNSQSELPCDNINVGYSNYTESDVKIVNVSWV